MKACWPWVPRLPLPLSLKSAVQVTSEHGRGFPAHSMTKELARMTYQAFVADLSRHLGLTHQIKPQLVVCDNGGYYISHYFREFLSSEQVAQRFSTPYVPQQDKLEI